MENLPKVFPSTHATCNEFSLRQAAGYQTTFLPFPSKRWQVTLGQAPGNLQVKLKE